MKQLSKKMYFEKEFENSENPREMSNTIRNLLPSKTSSNSISKSLHINKYDIN